MATMPHVKRGTWEQPVMRGYRMGCCDCGLVHTLDFRVLRRGVGTLRNVHVQFRAQRNNRSTAMLRKGMVKRGEGVAVVRRRRGP